MTHADPADLGEFRAALGRLAGGVVVLSTRSRGHDHAMTATAITSVSLDPPLVLSCIETDSRFYYAILESGMWGISILDATHQPYAEWLATPGRPLISQLDQVPHHRGESGVIWIDGSLATLECTTVAVHPAGDHSIIVGEVQSLHVSDEPGAALVYYRSRYGSIA